MRENIRKNALDAKRSPEDVRFILVTKTVPAEKILQAASCGVADFGENRVQELLAKKKEMFGKPGVESFRWHMIGHLQTNKVRQVLMEVALIHSLDRTELAEEIERQAALKKIKSVDCLIQINSSAEASKFGMRPEEAFGFVEKLTGPAIQVRGLMTIGPLTEDPDQIRRAFRLTKDLRSELRKKFPRKDWGILSMGMSGDYSIAIEEGANLVRIGSAVFGERRQ